MTRTTTLVLTTILALTLFAAAALIYQQRKDEQAAPAPMAASSDLIAAHAPSYGAEDARVTIVEFFDPACETCRAFYPEVKDIIDRSHGRVRLLIRYAPFHTGSEEAVRILEAARLQGLYWQSLEVVLQMQPQWAAHHKPDASLIWNYLRISGLDVDTARQAMHSPEINRIVASDRNALQQLNVTQTPSFFVNGKPLETFGRQPLRDLVERELAVAYPG